jgi:hypothetical protein
MINVVKMPPYILVLKVIVAHSVEPKNIIPKQKRRRWGESGCWRYTTSRLELISCHVHLHEYIPNGLSQGPSINLEHSHFVRIKQSDAHGKFGGEKNESRWKKKEKRGKPYEW